MSASLEADRRHITELLRAWKSGGDEAAADRAFSLLEPDLRRIAAAVLRRETGLDRKIQPTELVSELYLRLAAYDITVENRRMFFGLVAKVMRNALVDIARRDRAARRPPSRLRVRTALAADVPARSMSYHATEFYMLLDRLHALNPRHARLFELHCILGLSPKELSECFGVSIPTVKRDLRAARAWFKAQFASDVESA
jgi:RNA polymerase sigma factor (TIGR02999 family)